MLVLCYIGTECYASLDSNDVLPAKGMTEIQRPLRDSSKDEGMY